MRERLIGAVSAWGPDVVPALLVTALALSESGGFPGPSELHIAAIIVIGAALLLRRRQPLASTVTVAVAIAAQSLLAPSTPESAGVFLAVMVSLYSAAAHARGTARRVAVMAQVLANSITISRDPNVESFGEALPGIVIALAAWFVGELVGRRTAQASQAEAARAEAEARREAEALAAVERERARIARELHDVIAHGLGAIVLQAGAVRLGSTDQVVADKMLVIERTARQSLLELRGLLGILRRMNDAEPREAQLGLEGLEVLASPARAAGVDVRIQCADVADLPPGLELSVYRIVQEALTNVVRHAAASRCDVVVQRGNGAVEVAVSDDGRGESPASDVSGGYGLLGIRERVAVYGGTLDVGARPDGGFAVRASLPLEAGA